MKILIFFTIFTLNSIVNARTLKCYVMGMEKELDCKILSKDLRDLTENEVIEFDPDDEEFEDFTRLSFVETKMKDVPSGIFEPFSNLQEFILGENGLKEWKSEYLKGAKTLKYLYIAKNSFKHLKADSFVEAPNLEILEIVFNKLSDIDANAFTGLPKLYELRLNNNKIGQSLTSETFIEVGETLKTLFLGSNEIEEIPKNMLKNLKNLEQISLYLNKLKKVDGNIFPSSLKKIVGLIQFEIENPPKNLEYKIEENVKKDEL